MSLSVLAKAGSMLARLESQVAEINPFLYHTDSYKVSHINFEINGVKEIYSNFTPRFSKYIEQMLGDAFDGKYVVFGIQWMLFRLHATAKKGFFDRPKDEVIAEMKATHGSYIGVEEFKHFEALHDLGYLPVVVKTLDEGSVVNVGVPFLTIRNTIEGFEWLPNYLETLFSCDLWKQLTIATIARSFRLISNKYAIETTGSTAGTEFQNHDFGLRGQGTPESSAIVGAGFLTSSCGTDNIPALWACDYMYDSANSDVNFLAGSVPAGEHSVTTLGILAEQKKAEQVGERISEVEAEYRYKHWLLTERFPSGIVSDVADSFDYWSHITVNLPKLKDVIMARDGKYVVRGDSGNPVDIICGYDESDLRDLSTCEEEHLQQALFDITRDALANETDHGEHGDDEYTLVFKYDGGLKKAHVTGFQWNRYDKQYYYLDTYFSDVKVEITNVERTPERKGTIECLWDIFGGTVNEQGYKVLDSHIGMIYGDGITVQRSNEILSRLKAKGFASTNIVFGVGSYSLNMVSRDHLGMAIKATNAIVEINGVDVDLPIYKEPKTDLSKKSARGLISVHKNEDGNYFYKDKETRAGEATGLLTTVYENGEFKKITDIFEIRQRIWG